MTDPFVALDIVMNGIADGVEDGIRLWLMTVAAGIAVVVSAAWLFQLHARRNRE